VIDFYQECSEALGRSVLVEKLVTLPVRERIGRFKYVPADQMKQEYDEIIQTMKKEIQDLEQKEDY